MAIKKANYTLAAIIILVIGAVAGALAIGSSNDKPKKIANPAVVNTTCGPYRKDGVVTINGNQINVETAAGTAELTKGLSGRPCILSNWGMLFDFGRDGQYAIWMKDMKFPIDVAWIDSTHKVVAMEIDFRPSTYNSQQPEKSEKRVNQAPARYVLEIKANQSKQLNMDLGTQIYFQKT